MRSKSPKEKQGVARLFELAGQRGRKLTLACVLSVLSSAARIVPFFTIYGVVRELLAHYQEPSMVDQNAILTLCAVTFGAALVYGLCAFISSALSHTAAYEIIYDLRLQLMEKLSRVSSGFFTGTTQGAIKKVVSDDSNQIEAFLAHHLCEIAAAVATPVFTLLYLFGMDWRLAIVTLLPILISLVLLSACLKQPDKAALQVELHDAQERMQGTVVEYIHGMSVIKVFNRTLNAFQRYEGDLNHFTEVVDRTARANARPMGAYYAFFGAQLLFLLPAVLLLIPTAESYLDFLPVILLFFLVGSGLKEPMENLMQMVILSGRIVEGVNRIDNILRQPEPDQDGAGDPTTFDVEFSDVEFAYTEGIPAVDHVSFHLPQGTVTGLVGPSGGGKSTLAQLLLRFYEPQGGTIRIGGVDIREIPPARLMELVAYVFQDSVLFTDTIENNIRMGNTKVTMEEVEQAARNAGIHEVIQALPQGYQTVVGRDDAYLSGGEKQRLAIARVFLKDAPIIILDEATAYADAENEAKIQAAFAKLAQNKTVLMIAHRLKTVERADQILVMDKGKLVGAGTHEELLTGCEIYKHLVDANLRRDRWSIGKGAVQV
ncbi:ABC transporter, ATP-binding protein [Pseudoflavonifractor capillosus ATCC 29799]|uniref:ABC transporter, ATP-binding protein n=1 Tax=Pseudoflavonifractor capillosus ATCC 29799 TaxID=411467 RepID=A6NWJ0_9FIRM|nr:ABC transporter, ATP-binding protein [Pseudoflavonifractor capillosus ATCC 29799]